MPQPTNTTNIPASSVISLAYPGGYGHQHRSSSRHGQARESKGGTSAVETATAGKRRDSIGHHERAQAQPREGRAEVGAFFQIAGP